MLWRCWVSSEHRIARLETHDLQGPRIFDKQAEI
jgi:hypothetical protein